jgi:glycosyltransferase involved in cell wall biosynthesis
VAGRAGTWWEQILLPAVAAKDHLDVLFAPGYTAPLTLAGAVPTVVAVHDLSFAAHPEWFSMREGIRRRWLSQRSATRARAVITISKFTQRELTERFRVPESKVHVIPPGITPLAAAPAMSNTRLNVLYVGSIFNRRRLPDLIRAFGPIARQYPAASLDIVGDDRSFPPEDLRQLVLLEGLTEAVHWRGWVADRELAALYASARAFGFLSEYEGLGLTPLEALAAGVPPVLLDTAVARESCGGAALYVPNGDISATTRALERLLFDEATRGEILAAAPSVLARYDWPRAARETLGVIEACL